MADKTDHGYNREMIRFSTMVSLVLLIYTVYAVPCLAEENNEGVIPDFSRYLSPADLQDARRELAELYDQALAELDKTRSSGNLWDALNSDASVRRAFRGTLFHYFAAAGPADPLPDIFHDPAIVKSFGDDRWRDIRGRIVMVAQKNEEYRRWLQAELVESCGRRGGQIITGGELHWVRVMTFGPVDYSPDVEIAEMGVTDPPVDLRPLVQRHLLDRDLQPEDINNLAPILYAVYREENEDTFEEMYDLLDDVQQVIDTDRLMIELDYLFSQ